MAGMTGSGAGATGGPPPQQGPPPEELGSVAGSPAATQADLYQMQRRQQAGPIFGQGGGDPMAGQGQRIEAIKRMLAQGGGGGQAPGPTQVRRQAQPIMGGGIG